MAKAEQRAPQAAGANRRQALIAGLAVAAIGLHLLLRFGEQTGTAVGGFPVQELPLILCLIFGGLPLVGDLLIKLRRREFGSDLLARISHQENGIGLPCVS